MILALLAFMVNGLHTASKGMQILLDKVDVVSNNLANANTVGFKKSMLVSETEIKISRNDEYLLHQDENQKMSFNHIDFKQGPMIETGNPLDIALEGEGYIKILMNNETAYTRMGSLSLNALGELITLNGNQVLDESGSPLLIGAGKVTFSSTGEVYEDGGFIGKLGLVNFDKGVSMYPEGNNAFLPADPEADSHPSTEMRIRQGYIEGSNVNSIDSMIELIRHQRQFESGQKVIQSIDETLDKAVNQIGAVN